MRVFWPCCNRTGTSNGPKSNTIAGEIAATKQSNSDELLSPDRAPGPNLAFWRSSGRDDWGHQVYLTDLKRQAEAEAEGKRGSGFGFGFDKEAVREARDRLEGSTGSGRPPSRSSLSPGVHAHGYGQRISRGMGIGKSPIVASPLGTSVTGHGHGHGIERASPRSSTLSHSKLIKHRPSPVTSHSNTSTPSPTPLGQGLSLSPRRTISPATTVLPNPVLPPRHSSLSPMSAGRGVMYPRDSTTLTPVPGLDTPVRPYTNAVVPPVARLAYSPFTPRGSVVQGQSGQRDSIRSERGYAV
jgi:hypothetical protein